MYPSWLFNSLNSTTQQQCPGVGNGILRLLRAPSIGGRCASLQRCQRHLATVMAPCVGGRCASLKLWQCHLATVKGALFRWQVCVSTEMGLIWSASSANRGRNTLAKYQNLYRQKYTSSKYIIAKLNMQSLKLSLEFIRIVSFW